MQTPERCDSSCGGSGTYLEPNADFSMQLHLHEDNDEAAAISYWRDETGLPNANFYKTFIKPKGTGHRKKT